MNNAPTIMWFRSDLRLSDNTALNAALAAGTPIIPVFLCDPAILKSRYRDAPRTAFLRKALTALDKSLREHGSALLTLKGSPTEVLPELIQETGASALYFNRDYSPYALRRDAVVAAATSSPVYAFDDALLVAPGNLTKADGSAYTVFTPFKKKWLMLSKAPPTTASPAHNQLIRHSDAARSFDTLVTTDFGFDSSIATPEADESHTRQLLTHFLSGPIYNYEMGRNRLAADPAHDPVPGTSYLSAYLRFGLLSIRDAYRAAMRAHENATDQSGRKAVEAWVSELAWREFYQHILFHFPHVATGNFRREYDKLEWRYAPDELRAWKDGATGYPVIDAAMRQLRQTGWMPNRARMIVASFLTKDLLIDWREGERHFMRWLIDGNLAANNGGWQWAAGTGTDAQPYFRIFNPITQSRKFDADGAHIRRWIPELRKVPAAFIHAPWEINPPPGDYPPPIIDHNFARQRALETFQKAKQNLDA